MVDASQNAQAVDTIQMRGCIRGLLKDLDGNVVREINVKNAVVKSGRAWVLKQLHLSHGSW